MPVSWSDRPFGRSDEEAAYQNQRALKVHIVGDTALTKLDADRRPEHMRLKDVDGWNLPGWDRFEKEHIQLKYQKDEQQKRKALLHGLGLQYSKDKPLAAPRPSQPRLSLGGPHESQVRPGTSAMPLSLVDTRLPLRHVTGLSQIDIHNLRPSPIDREGLSADLTPSLTGLSMSPMPEHNSHEDIAITDFFLEWKGWRFCL